MYRLCPYPSASKRLKRISSRQQTKLRLQHQRRIKLHIHEASKVSLFLFIKFLPISEFLGFMQNPQNWGILWSALFLFVQSKYCSSLPRLQYILRSAFCFYNSFLTICTQISHSHKFFIALSLCRHPPQIQLLSKRNIQAE